MQVCKQESMSDFDASESSEDGDFSASEDEWVPGKNERESSEDEDEDEESSIPILK